MLLPEHLFRCIRFDDQDDRSLDSNLAAASFLQQGNGGATGLLRLLRSPDSDGAAAAEQAAWALRRVARDRWHRAEIVGVGGVGVVLGVLDGAASRPRAFVADAVAALTTLMLDEQWRDADAAAAPGKLAPLLSWPRSDGTATDRDVPFLAALALGRLATRSSAMRAAIATHVAVAPTLVAMLRDSDDAVAEGASEALLRLADGAGAGERAVCATIVSCGGIVSLAHLAKEGSELLAVNACALLNAMCRKGRALLWRLLDSEAPGALLDVLESQGEQRRPVLFAVLALFRMAACSDAAKARLLAAGAAEALADCLKGGDAVGAAALAVAASLVRKLAQGGPAMQRQMAPVASPLLALLSHPDAGVAREACAALAAFSPAVHWYPSPWLVLMYDGIDPLVALLRPSADASGGNLAELHAATLLAHLTLRDEPLRREFGRRGVPHLAALLDHPASAVVQASLRCLLVLCMDGRLYVASEAAPAAIAALKRFVAIAGMGWDRGSAPVTSFYIVSHTVHLLHGLIVANAINHATCSTLLADGALPVLDDAIASAVQYGRTETADRARVVFRYLESFQKAAANAIAGIPQALSVLRSDSSSADMRCAAAAHLAALTGHEAVRRFAEKARQSVASGGLPILVSLLSDEHDPSLVDHVCSVIADVSRDCMVLRQRLCDLGAIERLVRLLNSRETACSAAIALGSLASPMNNASVSQCGQICDAIVAAGAAPALVALLKPWPSSFIDAHMAMVALRHLASGSAGCAQAIAAAGALRPLIERLENEPKTPDGQAAAALASLLAAGDGAMACEAAAQGALQALEGVLTANRRFGTTKDAVMVHAAQAVARIAAGSDALRSQVADSGVPEVLARMLYDPMEAAEQAVLAFVEIAGGTQGADARRLKLLEIALDRRLEAARDRSSGSEAFVEAIDAALQLLSDERV